MKTKCHSVRLESIVRISDKAYKVRSFDGAEDIIPASQFFGQDYDVAKCDAYWIAAWILPKKNIQWSDKKEAWFDENGNRLDDYIVIKHKPAIVKPKANNEIDQLLNE